jgi:hypothetical protein
VPDDREYLNELADGARLRARFRRDRGEITEFVVQLEAWFNEEWCAVIRYDSAHGQAHKDVLDRWGREIEKQWLPGTNNDALTAGTADIKQNWKQYIAQFMEDKRR